MYKETRLNFKFLPITEIASRKFTLGPKSITASFTVQSTYLICVAEQTKPDASAPMTARSQTEQMWPSCAGTK